MQPLIKGNITMTVMIIASGGVFPKCWSISLRYNETLYLCKVLLAQRVCAAQRLPAENLPSQSTGLFFYFLLLFLFLVSRHSCWAIKQGSGLDTSHNIQGQAAMCRDRRTPGSNYFPYSDQTTEDATINIIQMPVTPTPLSIFFTPVTLS